MRAGDTLQGIAAQLWGDADLWYKLAEANGLAGGAALSEGQRLTLPSGISRSTNNASTFKAYDLNEALGDTNPISPNPTAKNKNKCGALGAILLTVVAVAVTALVAPWATGIAAKAGLGATAAAMAGGAVAGAAASVVSQGVGLATGIQDRFNWKGVALSALSGAVGGGLGTVKALAGGGFMGPAFDVARGALGNVAVQGIAVVTGLQSKFSFAGVAAAGATGGALGLTNMGGFAGRLLSGTAGAIAGGAARSLIDGSSFGDNIIRALPDVIGSTIGESVSRAVTGRASSMGVGEAQESWGGASKASGSKQIRTLLGRGRNRRAGGRDDRGHSPQLALPASARGRRVPVRWR